jgi:hypothetical protein
MPSGPDKVLNSLLLIIASQLFLRFLPPPDSPKASPIDH